MWSSCTDDALSGSEPAKNGHVHTPQLVDSGVVANVLRLRVRSPPQAEKDLLLLRGVFQYMHVLHSQRPQLACHHVCAAHTRARAGSKQTLSSTVCYREGLARGWSVTAVSACAMRKERGAGRLSDPCTPAFASSLLFRCSSMNSPVLASMMLPSLMSMAASMKAMPTEPRLRPGAKMAMLCCSALAGGMSWSSAPHVVSDHQPKSSQTRNLQQSWFPQ